ncbi:MAG TPA: GerMN domain-containing protein, partial [Acidimicrobiales bacterium]
MNKRTMALILGAMALVAVACGSTTKPTTATTAGQGQDVTVRVFFTPDSGGPDCSETTPVDRTVQAPEDLLSAALTELLAGPTTTERDAGLRSWFSADTADSLLSATIVDGTAHIDFKDFSSQLGGASSSCGSSQLLNQLDSTARQFPTVERTLYSFNGNVEAFYSWLQR